MDTKDIKLFDGKNFSDLLKEIYDNSKNKKVQVDLLISDVLAYITDAFAGGSAPSGAIEAQAFYDTSANFALTAGDGVFMAYLNPQSAGADDVALTMSIWAH